MTENDVPDWGGFWFVFKARQPAHSGLCNGCRNTEDGRKDPQDGISLNRNHLSPGSLEAVYEKALCIELAERGPQPSIFRLIGVHSRSLAAKKKISSKLNGEHNSSDGRLSLCFRVSPRRFRRATPYPDRLSDLGGIRGGFRFQAPGRSGSRAAYAVRDQSPRPSGKHWRMLRAQPLGA